MAPIPDAELDRRALRVFDDVCDLAPEARTAALDAACGDDAALRARVTAFLEQDACHTVPIADAAPGAGAHRLAHALADRSATQPPEQIGPYRIVREIGRGGMGVVYEAEQAEPQRHVAIKVLRETFASPDMRARFRREIHLLGQLQHPGIAHVYEAGTARLGPTEWPYFTMELIDGLPLDQHAQVAGLDRRARLELLARVCDSVHHAHQKAILHRDLKMENVLVVAGPDTIGQPKVLDFGVARHTDSVVGASAHHTRAGQLVGTLASMSPEQLAGPPDAVDTRTDVYALGVMLYALLAQRPPHDLTGASLADATRVITTVDPPRLGAIDPALRGDIETIVARAMAKDREQRYRSVAALGDDLRRFLRDEPIEARPAHPIYQFRKFSRRHRGLMLGLATALLVLLAGTATATWFAIGQYRANVVSQRAVDRAALAAAASAMRENDITTAALHLDAVPPARRYWEWQHLHAHLDQSVHSVSIRQDDEALMLGAASRGVAHLWFQDDGRTLCVAQVHRGQSKSARIEQRETTTLALRNEWTVDGTASFAPDNTGTRLYHRRELGDATLLDVNDGARIDTAPLLLGRYPWTLLTAMPPLDVAEAMLSQLPPLETGHQRLAFSADGRAVLRGAGAQIDVVRPHASPPLLRLEEHPEGIGSAVFTADRRAVITAGYDRQLARYDLTNGGRRVWAIPNAHDDAILSVALSPDGRVLASVGQDKIVRFHDAETGRALGQRMGHRETIRGVVFTPDGERVITVSSSAIKQWSPPHHAPIDAIAHDRTYVADVALSADGALLVTAHRNQLSFHDASSRLRVARVALDDPDVEIRAIEFTSDESHLLVQTRTYAVTVDLRSGHVTPWLDDVDDAVTAAFARVTSGFPAHEAPSRRSALDLFRLYGYSQFGAFSMDRTSRRMAASWGDPSRVSILDLDTGEVLHSRPHISQGPVLLYANGTRLAALTSERDISLFDVATGKLLATLKGHSERITSLQELPGGKRLVSASRDRTIRLWDLDTNQEVFDLRGHLDTVNALAIAPDGSAIYSASDDYVVRCWDTRSAADVERARVEWRTIAEHLTQREPRSDREREVARQLSLRDVFATTSPAG